MKRKGLLLLLAVLVLGLMAAPALGNNLTMNQTHTLSTAYSANLTSVGYVDYEIPNLSGYRTYAFAQGQSDVNGVTQGPNPQFDYTPTLTASDTGTYYPTNTAQVANLPTGINIVNFGFSQNMSAVASPPLGSTFQETTNNLTLIFQFNDTTPGNATLSITDVLSGMLYSATGDLPGFLNTNANSFFQALWFSDNQAGESTLGQYLLSDYREFPNTVSFNGAISAIDPVTFNLLGLQPGEYVYLNLYQDSTLETQSSAVPIPPTLLLFGSGLGGVLLLGWRRKLIRS